jgi:PAS domain S-box-containing protein
LYTEFFDGFPAGILLVKDGKVIYGNPAVGDLLLRGDPVLEGEDFVRLFHRDDRDALQKNLKRIEEGADPGGSHWFRMIRSDNSFLRVELNFTAMGDHDRGEVLFLIRDVSSQHRIAERLRQVKKLEALGQLAAGIVHDFNNVLGALANYARMITKHLEPTNEARANLVEMQELVERGAALVGQILSVSRRGEEKRAAHDINQVIGGVLRMLRHTLPKRVSIKAELGEIPPFLMDPGQIQQVMMNLCINAADAMPQGGVVTVRTERGRVSSEAGEPFPKITHDAFVRISVSDTGVGIEPDVLKRIFEPFYSTKGDDRSGLGLSICNEIVREHGGLIDVTSTPNEGSTVSIYLPFMEGPKPEAEVAPCEVRGGEETLLLVDDEETMLKSTTMLLQDLGYHMITAGSGPEAVDLFSKNPEDVDLILLDQGMPGMDGMETLTRLREIRPDVRVLLITGLSQSEEIQKALKQGAFGIIQKPFRLEDLSDKIREALEEAGSTS